MSNHMKPDEQQYFNSTPHPQGAIFTNGTALNDSDNLRGVMLANDPAFIGSGVGNVQSHQICEMLRKNNENEMLLRALQGHGGSVSTGASNQSIITDFLARHGTVPEATIAPASHQFPLSTTGQHHHVPFPRADYYMNQLRIGSTHNNHVTQRGPHPALLSQEAPNATHSDLVAIVSQLQAARGVPPPSAMSHLTNNGTPNAQVNVARLSSSSGLTVPREAFLSPFSMQPASGLELPAHSPGSQEIASSSSHQASVSVSDIATTNRNASMVRNNSGNRSDVIMDSYIVSFLPVTMSHPMDKLVLSSHQVYLREQIEFFQATQEDVSTPARGRTKRIMLGQVGIRCRHCANVPIRYRQMGSTYYPNEVWGLYQAAQNMCTTHLQCGKCMSTPDSVKDHFKRLLESPTRASSTAGRAYWAKCAKELGLVDTEDGIMTLRDLPPNAEFHTENGTRSAPYFRIPQQNRS